jgi:hypothetical protein
VGFLGAAFGVITAGAAAVGVVLPWLRRQLRLLRSQDIRVKVAPMVGLIGDATDPRTRCVRVRVENHSERDFFLGGVGLHQGTPDGVGLWTERDFATKRLNNGDTIRPGDAYDFYIPVEAVCEMDRDAVLVYAEAHDKIGRKFRTRTGELREVISELLIPKGPR